MTDRELRNYIRKVVTTEWHIYQYSCVRYWMVWGVILGYVIGFSGVGLILHFGAQPASEVSDLEFFSMFFVTFVGFAIAIWFSAKRRHLLRAVKLLLAARHCADHGLDSSSSFQGGR